MLVCYNRRAMKLKVHRKLIFCHVGPSWFSPVFIISYGYVILLEVVPCRLPSCFTSLYIS